MRELLKGEKIKPWVWLRYIDNTFFIWLGSEEELCGLLRRLNESNSNLKFAFEKLDKKINFLDVIVKIQNEELVTDLFCKPVDGHQYLHYNFCHAKHVKTSVVYIQALCIERICSLEDFKSRIEELRGWLKTKEYPDSVINQQVNKVMLKPSLLDQPKSKDCGVPLLVTHNPHLATLCRTIHEHLNLLNQDSESRKIFTPPHFVSFKSARNLKSHHVKSKIYPLVWVIGSTKCQNKRGQVCYSIRETDCFQSYNLNIEHKVNHKFHCNDKCLVYLLTCKFCWKQYVRQIVDRLEHKQA